jgi:hypothetical protein
MDLLVISKVVRVALGGLIVLLAYKAYRRTGYSPMLLVAIGFGLFGVASAVVEEAFKAFEHARLLAEMTEILGLAIMVIAIRRS